MSGQGGQTSSAASDGREELPASSREGRLDEQGVDWGLPSVPGLAALIPGGRGTFQHGLNPLGPWGSSMSTGEEFRAAPRMGEKSSWPLTVAGRVRALRWRGFLGHRMFRVKTWEDLGRTGWW